MKNTKAWRNLSNGAHPFTTTTELLVAASEYFQWCDDHPLLEEDVAVYQGDVTRYDRSKVRPYTLRGLGIYLNVSFVRLERYRVDNADFGAAMELIDQVIYTQKFEHAAAGLMNASIIKSDLGLTDKQELTGANGGAIKTLELTTEAHILDEARRLGIDVTALGFGVGKS